jgi:protein-disulfide isomerase
MVESRSNAKLETALGLLLTAAACAVAFLAVEQRLKPPPPPPGTPRATQIEDWSSRSVGVATLLSKSRRKVHIDVVTDFECPFCRLLDSTLTEFEKLHPNDVSRAVVHLPLTIHASARTASIAFECAAALGSAEAMSSTLFRFQERLADVLLDSLAITANVGDLGAFRRCVADPVSAAKVDAGAALIRELGISGTPVAIVNGWRIDPSLSAVVVRALENALDGKPPKP